MIYNLSQDEGMMKQLLIFGIFLILLYSQAAQADAPQPRVVAYYTSWSVYGLQYFVTDIPAALITHLNYAFFDISETGECRLGDEWADTEYWYPDDKESYSLHGNLGQLQRLKASYPHLKTLMSIGGWTSSAHFSTVASTPENRLRFARSCVEMMQRYSFDGLDIDWEFPVSGGLGQTDDQPDDKPNFTLLLAALREELNAASVERSEPYLLTIAAPAVTPFYDNLAIDQIHPYLDWINLMTYSFHGGWSAITNHHAALYLSPNDPDEIKASVDTAVQVYLAADVPPNKLVIGIPFYAQVWGEVSNNNGGLYQPFGSLPEGRWSVGIMDQKEVKAATLPTTLRYWDATAQVPWLYNPETQIMISYEDEQSISAKAQYIQAHQLGGMMIWELAYDDADHRLLKAIFSSLHKE